MLLSLALIFLVGLVMAGIFNKMGLPKIIGMLFTGILLGPFVLDVLDAEILDISAQLRQIALIIILLKAGLTLNIEDLKKVGRPAVLMSFLPASFEIAAYCVFAPLFFKITFSEALLMGSVLSAVSPAVVVPRMVNLIEERYGTKKSIPQLILAGASCDDIFVIVVFYAFLSMAQGEMASLSLFIDIPLSMVLGIAMGAILGMALNFVFETAHKKSSTIRNSTKVIILLGVSFLAMSVEHMLTVSFSGLLCVVCMACTLKLKSVEQVTKRLSEKFGKLWIAAEVLLFVLVGAAVNVEYMLSAGLKSVFMIFIGLAIRSVGIVFSLLKTELNNKERLFCLISYLPKATVQAAIGSIPLAMGIESGGIILSTAVLAIIITAPLGAIGIDKTYKRLLSRD